MEEFKFIFYGRIHELFAERIVASDPVAYAAKWDSLRTYVDSLLHNLKSFTSETVASTNHRQEQLEKKLATLVDKQVNMDSQL